MFVDVTQPVTFSWKSSNCISLQVVSATLCSPRCLFAPIFTLTLSFLMVSPSAEELPHSYSTNLAGFEGNNYLEAGEITPPPPIQRSWKMILEILSLILGCCENHLCIHLLILSEHTHNFKKKLFPFLFSFSSLCVCMCVCTHAGAQATF